jgi:ElaA protein
MAGRRVIMAKIRKTIEKFQICSFDALTTHELYEILRARADIFVGEEKILYPDADGLDYGSIHVFSLDADGKVTSYLRMFPKEDEPGTVHIGRVLTRVHGKGLGRQLLEAAFRAADEVMQAKEIYVEAQKHAEGFYRAVGFQTTSGDFMEAGVVHVQMRRKLH